MSRILRTKQRRWMKPPMPPLSPLDRTLYWIGMILAVCVMLSFLLVSNVLQDRMAFKDPMVIAVTSHSSVLYALLPMFFLGLPLLGVVGSAYRDKRPLFGNREVQYGSPEYAEVYPLFTAGKSFRDVCKELLSGANISRAAAIVMLVLMVISILLFPLSFYGRDQLYADGSVARYSILNGETERYTPSAVAELRLSIDEDIETSMHEPILSPADYDYTAFITLVMVDGEECTFNMLNLRNEGQQDKLSSLQMALRLRALFPPEIITCLNTDLLDSLIREEHLNEQEAELLNILFSIPR